MRNRELWVVLVGGGVRGAVGLTLASALFQEHLVDIASSGNSSEGSSEGSAEEEEGGGGVVKQEELFFYVAGITVLTLLLNGTLITPYFEWLNVSLRRKKKEEEQPQIKKQETT